LQQKKVKIRLLKVRQTGLGRSCRQTPGHYILTLAVNWAVVDVPVIPAAQEAEGGGSQV
jgi:hypothetical protein